MKKRNLLTSLCAAALLLSNQSAHGLGLGRINLQSYLNQPLNAQVPINALGDISPSEIRVRLASREAFEKVGIDRPYFLTQLQFDIVEQDGNHFLSISSPDPITDPFLSFVVEANWASGTVLREYTILLDPIDVAKPKVYAQKPRATRSAQRSHNRPFDGQVYGPVRSDDTLWHIAKRVAKQTQTDVHQSMLAIVQKNPQAFIRGNMNGLRNGEVLQLPGVDEIVQISVSEAIAKVAEHREAWRSKRVMKPMKSLANNVQPPPKAPSKPLTLVMPTQPGEKSEQDSPKSTKPWTSEAPEHHAQSTKSSSSAPQIAKQIDNRLLMIEETLDTLKRTNQALTENQKNLAEKNKDLLALLAEKEQEIALLKQAYLDDQPIGDNTATDKAMTAEKSQQPALAESPEQQIQDQILSYTQHQQGQKVVADTQPKATTADTKQVEPVTNKTSLSSAQTSPQPLPPPVVSGPPATTPGMPQEQDSWWMMLAIIFGVSAFGGMGAFTLYRRQPELFARFMKRSAHESDAQAPVKVNTQIVPQDDRHSNEIKEAFSVFEQEAHHHQDEIKKNMSDVVDQHATSSASSMNERSADSHHHEMESTDSSISESSVDHGDMNILADADVYIEYERFSQAEQVLTTYLNRFPKDWEAHLKLLDVYKLTHRLDEMGQHISALPADLASTHPQVWQKIQQLIEEAMAAPQTPAASESVKPSEISTQSAEPTMASSLETEPSQARESDPQAHVSTEAPKAPSSVQDHAEPNSLNLAEKCGVDAVKPKFTLAQSDEDTVSQTAHSPQASKPQALEDDCNYLEEENEVETKLALAKAYLDLDDIKMAHEHLAFVMEHGNDEQKAEAQELLDDYQGG